MLPLRIVALMWSRLASRMSPACRTRSLSLRPVLPVPSASSSMTLLSWWMVVENLRSFPSLVAAASNSELTFLMMVVICSRVVTPPSELSRSAFDSSSSPDLILSPFPSATPAAALMMSLTGP
ncbi:Uncharacterised protein [Mycobacteroides abscessus subsp. abscessus]|nr:Uncharacterised protein [Mycobacteroides abscessus subsp. abscessus]